MALTQSTHDRGAFGSPTFFVGNEMFFGKERLQQVEEALTQREAARLNQTLGNPQAAITTPPAASLDRP